MSIPKDEFELPATTADLLPYLQTLYPAAELATYVLKGDDEGARVYVGKLQLIDELLSLHREQNERVAAAHEASASP